MNEQEKENTANQEIADKSITEEQLAQELNTDEAMSGSQFLGDEDMSRESALELELEEAKDKYLRLAAEFDNFKRRNVKERMELHQTAGRDIIQSLLDVVDDSNRAAQQMETTTDIEILKEGINLVFNKLRNTLQQKGLKAMESAGEEFDAELHEAITEIPAPTPAMVGKVVDVVQPGYYLNDKLIRHAKVVVGK